MHSDIIGTFIADDTLGKQGRAQDFSLAPRPKAESGDGVLGEGAATLPLPQLGSLGSAVSSPSGVRDGAPTAKRFSTIFSTQDGLS